MSRHVERLKTARLEAAEHELFHGHRMMTFIALVLRDNRWFQAFITLVILVASVLVGVQTYDGMEQVPALVHLDFAILMIFVLELAIKFVAEGKKPWLFFHNSEAGWNTFDFIIVVLGLVPLPIPSSVLRLVRLLRVLKLVKALPKLSILVSGLLKSLSSIGYVGMLLFLVLYLFGCMGVSFFGQNDSWHFGTLVRKPGAGVANSNF